MSKLPSKFLTLFKFTFKESFITRLNLSFSRSLLDGKTNKCTLLSSNESKISMLIFENKLYPKKIKTSDSITSFENLLNSDSFIKFI